MFWKLIALSMVLWVVGVYLSVTLAGFIHILPVAAAVCVIVRLMGKRPDSAFGRWRPAAVPPWRR